MSGKRPTDDLIPPAKKRGSDRQITKASVRLPSTSAAVSSNRSRVTYLCLSCPQDDADDEVEEVRDQAGGPSLPCSSKL